MNFEVWRMKKEEVKEGKWYKTNSGDIQLLDENFNAVALIRNEVN